MYGQIIINGLILGAGYGLVAVSFGLIYETARLFHFAHGGVYAAGAYLLFTLAQDGGTPAVIGIPIAVCGAAAIGVAIELGVYRPLRRVGSSGSIMLLASLGVLIVIQNILAMVFGDATVEIPGRTTMEGLSIMGGRITRVQLVSVLMNISMAASIWAWLRWTRVGRLVRAVSSDSELSKIVGVNTSGIIACVFALGSGVVGIAGILAAFDTDLTPLMGFRPVLMGVVACIIGGLGSIPGAVLSGVLIGILESITAFGLPGQWQDAVVFVLLILFLLLRPQGVFKKDVDGLRVRRHVA